LWFVVLAFQIRGVLVGSPLAWSGRESVVRLLLVGVVSQTSVSVDVSGGLAGSPFFFCDPQFSSHQ
jgi:hypothetical protein